MKIKTTVGLMKMKTSKNLNNSNDKNTQKSILSKMVNKSRLSAISSKTNKTNNIKNESKKKQFQSLKSMMSNKSKRDPSLKSNKTVFQDFNDNENLFKQYKADLTIKKHVLNTGDNENLVYYSVEIRSFVKKDDITSA